MALENFATITADVSNQSDSIGTVTASQGDVSGRIFRFVLYDGGDSVDPDGLTATFWLQQSGGLYQQMTVVDGADTATWDAPLTLANLDAGIYIAQIAVSQTATESVICTFTFEFIIEPSVQQSSTSNSAMEDALSDFEERVEAAMAQVDEAIERANTATGNISANVDDAGVVTVTDSDGTETQYDIGTPVNAAISNANTAADSASTAATSATDAAEDAENAAESAWNAALQESWRVIDDGFYLGYTAYISERRQSIILGRLT